MKMRRATILVILCLAWPVAGQARKPAVAAAPAPAGAAQAFQAGLAPYLSHSAAEPGWMLAGAVEAVEAPDGVITLRLPDLAYRHPISGNGPLVLEFGTVTATATRAGEGWRVAITPPAAVALRDGDGTLADLSLGESRIEGLWLPGREAFQSLDVGITDLRGRLRNGDLLNIGTLGLRATGFGAAATERLDASASLGRFVAETAQGRLLGHVDTAALAFKAEGLDGPAAQIHIDWSHSRPVERGGIAAEVTPARFEASGKIVPLPWVAVLRHLPNVVAGLAAIPDEGRQSMAQELWNRVRPVLHAAEARVADLVVSARSASLSAFGRGEAAFPRDGGQSGRLVVDVRGINERIAALSSDDRRREPLLFPGLALMTVLGEGVNEGGRRHHRYNVELVDNGLRLNGKDVSAIQPPK